MKNRKNKKIISIMLILGMLSGVCMVSTAAGNSTATRDSLRSQGAVRYEDGTESVVIDSADLYTLADKLDLFKVRTAQQLGAIGTYLSKDPGGIPLTSEAGIYAAHQKPSSSDETDPLSLSFETILEGIAASQSISTDPAAYGMGTGTTLYKTADGKLSSIAQEGAEPIRIQAAAAENLSAGTAAWVNGRLILGTGEDNQSYHDRGYQEGIEEKGDSGDQGGGAGDPGDSGDQGDDSGDAPENPEPTISGVERMECIKMNNSANVYVAPEDMNDVMLVFFGKSKFQLSFASSEVVTYKEVFNKVHTGVWNNVSCTIYFIPELKKGTGINIRNEACYLLHVKDPNKKSGQITAETLSADSYYVQEDREDVILLQCGSAADPAFQEAAGNPIVAFKQMAKYTLSYNDDSEGNPLYYSFSLYYIPELKAETVISKHKNGVLFY
ncbi:MAG: hypothetical protein NC302_07670 [Bacteroidales bacterium]|nr:hypothetical protein [Bacteroidales bacterium]MCM1414959.1 hypothetical protein [bacterium]MCM1423174.1 hypothetical protein [bacterium]